MSADVPLPPLGSIGPCGTGGERVKNSKIWVVSFVQWTTKLTISIFFSASKCGSICRPQTCAHSGVEPSRSAKAILEGGPKSSKKFRIFHYFEIYVHISQKRLKLKAYKQHTEKALSLPYPTVACVWTHGSWGSTGWAKN